jgi:hypothetical protein
MWSIHLKKIYKIFNNIYIRLLILIFPESVMLPVCWNQALGLLIIGCLLAFNAIFNLFFY